MPITKYSGSQVMTLLMASMTLLLMVAMPARKLSLLRLLTLGVKMRLKWLVTPAGRRQSKSGSTTVFVDGASTPNFRRQPKTSGMGVSLEQKGAGLRRSPRQQRDSKTNAERAAGLRRGNEETRSCAIASGCSTTATGR